MDLAGLRKESVVSPNSGVANESQRYTAAADHFGYQQVLWRFDADVTHLDDPSWTLTLQEGDGPAANHPSWRDVVVDPVNHNWPWTVTFLPTDEICTKFGQIPTINRKRYFRFNIAACAVDEGERVFLNICQILLEPNIVISGGGPTDLELYGAEPD